MLDFMFRSIIVTDLANCDEARIKAIWTAGVFSNNQTESRSRRRADVSCYMP